jgi:hypothetical protein
MDENKFAGLLKVIVPKIMEQYIGAREVEWDTAIGDLYNSTLYKALEDPETGVWHFSPVLLSDLLIEEMETGHITWPEEQ